MKVNKCLLSLILFNMIANWSDDTLNTTLEDLAASDNVALDGHPYFFHIHFFRAINFLEANGARLGLKV